MALVGDWKKFQKHIEKLPRRLDIAMQKESALQAHLFEKAWVTGITGKKLGLKANAPLTSIAKKSTTPLVDHGDLIGSIRAYRKGKKWFTGVLKGAKKKDGGSLYDIAMLHEYGSKKPIKPKGHPFLSIPVTRKASRAGSPRNMEGLVFHKTSKGGVLCEHKARSTIIHYILTPSVTIPARPALRRSHARFIPISKQRYADVIKGEVQKHYV